MQDKDYRIVEEMGKFYIEKEFNKVFNSPDDNGMRGSNGWHRHSSGGVYKSLEEARAAYQQIKKGRVIHSVVEEKNKPISDAGGVEDYN